ncbi:hypothetical protein OEW28_13820 [Defluviimonas sp. WL0002]|uniref:PepSY domain-containing protein n=1 Tax=Albidovulum marisflavi TaxID=2984159 RepID=A0ABT2ZFB4_9RHOB|nr:hypothetical protein [Defluviimonas sp. WL0002]MCV2869707.1 hypothetical protein [Defluviimonas sp. WL0002]
MQRRQFILAATAAMIAAAPAHASDIVSEITAQLRKQGYTSISVTRTLLGRQRIFARSSEYQREIIVNPRTGEILRDYWSVLSGASIGSDEDMSIISTGSGDDDDDDDDDEEDDDDKEDKEDDNSGSSDNSGSGGSDDD